MLVGTVRLDGSPRLSLVEPLFEAGTALVGSRCDALHKIVEFTLEPGRDLILQLSGAAASEIGVAVTGVAKSG